MLAGEVVLSSANAIRLEDQRVKKKEMDVLAHKSSDHAQSVDKEAAETAEMHAAIASITKQRDARAQHRDRIRGEISTTRKQIAQRLSAQDQYAKEVNAQAQLNGPELDFWQTYLGMRIEGAGLADRLKFVFTHVDEKDWGREVCFELDTKERDYRVVTMKPKLDPDDVERCVEKLNEGRDLGPFLKGMRELFTRVVK